jgi:hypothetical protein
MLQTQTAEMLTLMKRRAVIYPIDRRQVWLESVVLLKIHIQEKFLMSDPIAPCIGK